MSDFLGITVLVLYVTPMLFILMYSMVQFHLVINYLHYRRHRKKEPIPEPLPLKIPQPVLAGGGKVPVNQDNSEFPFVTVQLPIYNELYVVERLIEAVADFEYPSDRFEIQVLDDSTDETVEIIANKVAEVRALKGVQIEHIRREHREGYKAGALKDGLKSSKGEFVAIFDADFIPPADFLRNTIPYFTDDKVGLVQTRWDHINENYSILTKLLAFLLDAHFSVEQKGRNSGGYFMNFNGTAGVWRRKTIDDAGGWHSDTLTEDLDLSYRAQLKGWKFKFIEDLLSPAELPMAMNAIKSQQFRWTKGGAETAKKSLGKVMRAKLPLKVKLHAFFHLMNSSLFICVLITALLSVPVLFAKGASKDLEAAFNVATIFLVSPFALIVFYWTSRISRDYKIPLPKRIFRFFFTFLAFLSLSMGFALHNTVATLEGWLGFKSPFIRTPKFNVKDMQDNWRTRTRYLTKKISVVTWLEGVLSLYFISGIAIGIKLGDYALLPFHTLLAVGFGTVFYYSVRHARLVR